MFYVNMFHVNVEGVLSLIYHFCNCLVNFHVVLIQETKGVTVQQYMQVIGPVFVVQHVSQIS